MSSSWARHIRALRTAIVLAAVLMATGFAAVDTPESAGLSHLTPHLAAERLSHLGPHRPGLPPPALLVPLGNGVDDVLKGVTLADEALLIDELIRAELTCQVLRVGVAAVAGQRVGIIKLQAGGKASGAFSLHELQADAARCLATGFTGALPLDHLDVWAVVPGAEQIGEEQENQPVFSLSTGRREYERAAAVAAEPQDLLAELDAVRYSPLFLRYAGPDGQAARPPRGSVYSDPELGEGWQDLLARARSPWALAQRAAQQEVSALLHGRRDVRQVALTIDDGPHPLITPLVLAILAEKGVKATFFVVGKKAQEYPALLRMIARQGHELGNHAYSNHRIHQLPADEAWAEIEACQRVIYRITGDKVRYFRPPGGGCSPDGLRAAGALGHTTVFWTRNTGDWRKPPPQEIVDNALAKLTAGDIILMHQGDMCSVEALPAIIAGIRDLGLEPTTVGEIDRDGGTVRDTPEALSKLVNSRWLGRE